MVSEGEKNISYFIKVWLVMSLTELIHEVFGAKYPLVPPKMKWFIQ